MIVSSLVAHSDDDQIVPIVAAATLSPKLVKDSVLKVYPGAPHGLTSVHGTGFNDHPLDWLDQ